MVPTFSELTFEWFFWTILLIVLYFTVIAIATYGLVAFFYRLATQPGAPMDDAPIDREHSNAPFAFASCWATPLYDAYMATNGVIIILNATDDTDFPGEVLQASVLWIKMVFVVGCLGVLGARALPLAQESLRSLPAQAATLPPIHIHFGMPQSTPTSGEAAAPTSSDEGAGDNTLTYRPVTATDPPNTSPWQPAQ
jgi:hypothetical protein